MCCATLRGMPSSFRPAEVLFQERALVLFYAWLLPTDRWLLVAPFACIYFVRSLTWPISGVKHERGCGGRDPLRPMPDLRTTKGRDVRRPILLLRVGSYSTCRFLDIVTYRQPELAMQIIAK